MKIEDLVIGQGAEAKTGSSVAMHYTGRLTDGSKFDSSHDRGQTFDFTLGQGRVIKGWDEGIPGMKVGGKRRLTIPPEKAYGERGFGKIIPPGSTLVFEVELVAVRERRARDGDRVRPAAAVALSASSSRASAAWRAPAAAARRPLPAPARAEYPVPSAMPAPSPRPLLALALLACDPSSLYLGVELRTDFVPGIEFTAIEVTIEDAPAPRALPATRADDFATAPRRVAELDGLAPRSPRDVTIRLRDAGGALVVERTSAVTHTSDRSVVIVVSRRCRGVACEEGSSCHAGRCQPDTCDRDACAVDCTADPDCASAACATPRCLEGVCFTTPVAGACPAGTWCNPETGCTPDPSASPDAGAPDAGPPDAGAIDAGHDGGGIAPTVRRLAAGGSTWTDLATTGAAPADPVRAAFASGTEVIVLTDARVHVLEMPAARWIDARPRAAVFPELDGVAIWEATEIPATDRLLVYAAAGEWQYSWDRTTRTATPTGFTPRDALAAWGEDDAPRWFEIHGAFGHPDNADGWVTDDPSNECPGHTRVGRYVAYANRDEIFGPPVPLLSIYDPDCPSSFVDQDIYFTYPPFAADGAPDPAALEALAFVGGALIAFE